jgi:hypothetical protein
MRFPLLVVLLVALGACQTTDTSRLANVQVSFATQAPAPSAARMALGDTIIENGNTLVIIRAEIVLREVELKRVEAADCQGNDACEEFETGPVLVDLPLGPGAAQRFALDIPPGTYDQVEFDIHKPGDDDPADLAFLQAHPDFAEISIRVQGTFNGTAFTFTTDMNVEQRLSLSPALVIIDETSSTNLTIFVELAAWFRDEDAALINPALANKGGVFESIVRNNIQQSMRAFEDDDDDGADD